MKKVLLTAAAALAVFGSAKVLADNSGVFVEVDGKNVPVEEVSAESGVYTNDTMDRTVGGWVEDNSKPATIAEAEAANEARLAKNSLDKTAAANAKKAAPAAKDPAAAKAPGAKVLPKTSAVK